MLEIKAMESSLVKRGLASTGLIESLRGIGLLGFAASAYMVGRDMSQDGVTSANIINAAGVLGSTMGPIGLGISLEYEYIVRPSVNYINNQMIQADQHLRNANNWMTW